MNKTAQRGNIFVLTEKGYNFRKARGINDIQTGQSFTEYKETVPESWVDNGWVEEKVGKE